MSSGGTVPFSAATSPTAGADDDVECRACYGVVVACVSLLLFCVVAATAGVLKAGIVTGTAVLLLGVIGWLVPAGASTRRPYGTGARQVGGASAGCACRLVGAAPANVPPAFAYECGPADAEVSGKPGGGALCAVCLEDVRRGEAAAGVRAPVPQGLRRHVAARAHDVPACRCDLVPRDVLPPV
ncbi:hypothetical protein C2845_PM11G19110 [Panicum miliaceum]|uniref:Uncharacterized protein n=1 Tax=Panicum miliaceum TaxID=4540 RepID=A0A3L6RTW3_PANMI|nr:hypothetical protein C2845_PM11G19110 [Panicum miliaceum]